MKIFKYPLQLCSEQTIHLPTPHKTLSVEIQNEQICLWALVDEHGPIYGKQIHIFGTGHDIPSSKLHNLHHLGTTLMNGGSLVWHVFEEFESQL